MAADKNSNYITSPDTPQIIREFLVYTESIRGKSKRTVDEYFLDLRVFFRYIKRLRGFVPDDTELSEIPIADIDVDIVRSVTLTEVYAYMSYLNRDRNIVHNTAVRGKGLGAATRARKTCALRMFYKYLTVKAKLFEENPVKDLETPKIKRSLPRYLSVDESTQLLNSVSGEYAERDYAILTLFLNCGLRVSELVTINLNDIRDDTLRVTGKGNKERMVYLNDACFDAIKAWLPKRASMHLQPDEKAMFVSRQNKRISPSTVKWLVKKHIGEAGLDSERYSAHKLRHTAATLMYQNGVDVRALQQLLGHENLDTTKIYTHVDNEQIRDAVRHNPLASIKSSRQPLQVHSEDSALQKPDINTGYIADANPDDTTSNDK